MQEQYTVAIIGAGVVGCAISREIKTRYPDIRVIVLEKHRYVAKETSGLNSGVLHSGLHQNPRFLKSQLAKEGSILAAEYAHKNDIRILDCGMLIAVPKKGLIHLWRDVNSFVSLMRRGREQDIPFTFLTESRMKKFEPNITACGGIFIPNVWVVDPVEFTNALYVEASRIGVQFYFGFPVYSINASLHRIGWNIGTPGGRIIANAVINSAGLYADDIARLAGFSQYHIYPWRGEYYEVIGEKAKRIQRLVYPVVPHGSKSKGIHIGPRVDGRLFLGPNARPVPLKDYYTEDKTPPEAFLSVAGQFCPWLKKEDLRWAYSGIRPKTSQSEGETDFIISRDREFPLFINLIGIESPGFASAMAIANYICDEVGIFPR